MTSKQASAQEERIADISMRSQTKAKVEVRKVSLGPNQEALVVLCLLDLGIKCVSFGRQVSASVAMNVLSNTHQSLQLHLLKMTSVERARTRTRRRRRRRGRRRRRTRRRATAPGRQAEVRIARRAHRVSRTKGENHLPLAQQSLTLRPVLIACRKAFTPNRTVSFGSNVEIFEVPTGHDCNLNPCQAKHRTHNPVRVTKSDRSRKDRIEARESDAILAEKMLQSAVFRELHGKPCKCNFACDSDIGCRHCIRSDLNALPGHMPSQQRNASAEIAWIADTGSAQDFFCSKMIPEDLVYHSHEPLELITANDSNGSQSADQQASVHIDCIGMRCMDGWDFVWKSFSRPYFKKQDGTQIKLEVKDYVPYLPSKDGQVPAAVGIPFSWDSAAGNGKPIISPVRRSRVSAVGTESEDEVEEVEEPYEASIADDDKVLGHADDSLEEFFPGEIAPGPPAAMTPDVIEGSEDEAEALEEPVDGRLQLPEPKALDRGEAALREEARTLRHMMTHTPKNPFCETCKCAKMYKPTKRSKGESLTVESNKFGDHITGDHLVTRDSN